MSTNPESPRAGCGTDEFIKILDAEDKDASEQKTLKTVVYDSRRLIKGLCFLIITVVIATFVIDVTLRKYIDDTHVMRGDGGDSYPTMRDARDDIVHTGIAMHHVDIDFEAMIWRMHLVRRLSYAGITSDVHSAILTSGGDAIDLRTDFGVLSITKDNDMAFNFASQSDDETLAWIDKLADDDMRPDIDRQTCLDRMTKKCQSLLDQRSKKLCVWSCGQLVPKVYM